MTMRETVISTTTTTTIELTDADTLLTLARTALLTTSAEGIVVSGDAPNRSVAVEGEISSGAAAIVFGSSSTDLSGTIRIGSAGFIHAGRGGILSFADGTEINQGGTIEARLVGVVASGVATAFTNNGTITSQLDVAAELTGVSAMIVNNGRLAGYSDGLRASGDRANITNNGSIGSTKAAGIVTSGNNSTVTNNGSIGVQGHGIVVNGAGEIITNNGKVGAGGIALLVRGTDSIVTNSGSLNAGADGINLQGARGIVTNNKSIEVGGDAITVSARDAIVNNTGTIKGASGLDVTGANIKAVNSGTITGWKAGVGAVDFTLAANGNFTNDGTVTALAKLAFKGGNGVQTLINRGVINGDVELGGGNDYIDNTGGTVKGHIAGGTGNDTYVISNAKTLLIEAKNGGIDTVRSSVSYVLSDNFENLTLTGSKALNATGNSAANQLHGNDANNVIKGMAGNDLIWGHGGNDTLSGGAGTDTFFFANGDGRDTITDFKATGSDHDILDLAGLSSITSFADLKANHMTQVGKDVLIDSLEGDTILLKNVKLAQLDKMDFHF
ncbi:hypothetical protein BJF93_17915 [Xaviernesmea oryzae]|uniref:Uncharacterized protein n=1 Tax=Xaviernesmea oryzae TaxID=464029 RepID=A0A1Q9ATI0_9HYPH|nr:calcium-binding protein [Xaviernesmea oryzae]OLP58699.1 hypothetical protein BJF93_17915 [Xaviernesmea oryzae]SEK68718.1 hypothetical protein SAMN04487976_103292 [Xaviernesmea oryzae]